MDIIGNKYGKLTVIKEVDSHRFPSGKCAKRFECLCDCGKFCIVLKANLFSGHTKSCGCLFKKHNMSQSKLYNLYRAIKTRCYNVNNERYNDYGGRGIIICDEWRNDFMAFYNWAMNNGYKEGLTIDRIDNDGNYEPSNCRWTDKMVQNNNKRNNHLVEYNGKAASLADTCRENGFNYNMIKQRMSTYGYTFEEAITAQKNNRRKRK